MLRVVVLLNAVALNAWRHDSFQRPVLALVVVAVMTGWTGVAIWAYAESRRRRPPLLWVDLGVTLLVLASSPVLKGEGFNATVPGFWVMGALFAWAVHWHWRGGLVAALALSVVDLGVRDQVAQANYGNVFLLMIGGPIIGYVCESLQRMSVERDRAERAAAAAAERVRLARAVHDGVLQVLALVQRRGAEAGAGAAGGAGNGELAELGRLAGEQERSLRSLIRQQESCADPPAAAGPTRDLSGALEQLGGHVPGRVEVVTPGRPVLLEGHVVDELVAVVGACLDNVRRHVAGEAGAWVLLEELPDRVLVSVRDEGPGIPEGRLAEAEAEGRLGVSGSIRGRVADLGGTATLDTGPHGTEWEVSVPR